MSRCHGNPRLDCLGSRSFLTWGHRRWNNGLWGSIVWSLGSNGPPLLPILALFTMICRKEREVVLG